MIGSLMNRFPLVGLKIPTTLISCLSLLLSMAAAPVDAQLITADKIRTYTLKLNGWNMETDQFSYHWVQLPAQIKNTQVLNVQVLVFSDEAKPEVFNLTRQSGKTSDSHFKGKSGGRSNFYFNDNGQLFIQLNRGDCDKDANGNCLTGVGNLSGFFGAGNHNSPANSYPNRSGRTFYDAGKIRVSVKIEYYCTSCAATSTNKFWLKVGQWDMSIGQRSFMESAIGIPPQNIVDLNATIYSDPNAANKIQVDNFEHLGVRRGNVLHWRGRGGMLWFGYGLNSSSFRLNMAAAPAIPVIGGPVGSSYRTTTMTKQPERNSDGSWPPLNDVELKYRSLTSPRNRGWVLVEYTGAKSAIPSPYLFLSRALPIGTWNMPGTTSVSLPLPQFGVSASRIGRLATSIQSDPSACLPGCNPGVEVNNFHRTMQNSGHLQYAEVNDVGGLTYIDESEGPSGSVVLSEFGGFASTGFYNTTNWYSTYTGAGNRGHVLIDYLAGSCAQGGSGFSLKNIPDAQIAICQGTGNTVIEGSGTKIKDAGDEFTFAHKLVPSGSSRTLIARLVSKSASSDFTSPNLIRTGIMIRSGLNANDRFAAILITPNNNCVLRYRSATGGTTTVDLPSAGTAISATPWVKLEFTTGNTFKAWYSNSTSTTAPTSWTALGTATINGFPTSNYYTGIAATNGNERNINQAVYSNLQGF
jgi:hypothetical protein